MELRKVRLGEICNVNARSIQKNSCEGDIQYLDTSNLAEGTISQLQEIAIAKAPSRAQRLVSNETILFSMVRPNQKHFGILSNPPENMVVSTGFATLDVKDKTHYYPAYVYYLLTQESVVNYLQTLAEGSVSSYPSVNPYDIANLSFTIPEYVVQRKIGRLLSDIDRKIALNRRMNATLEAMARQLYDYWFVQFDFPDAHGKPYKSSGGKMTWNDKLKREIPEGWRVSSVNEISTMTRGVSYTQDDLVDEKSGTLVLRGNNIQNNHLVYDSNVAYIPKTFVSDEQQIRRYDIIMTMSSGSKEHVGKSVMFQSDSDKTFGAFLSKFTPDSDFPYLLSQLFNSDYFKTKVKRTAIGTGINNLTNQSFDEILTIVPPKQLLASFNQMQKTMYDEMGNLQDNSLHLTLLRSTLLPLLMNGQVELLGNLDA